MFRKEKHEAMKQVKLLLAVLTALALTVVPAFAQEVPNPSTGDHNIVAIALVVMGIAAVAIAAVLFLGGKGKKNKKKKNPSDKF